MQRKPWEWPPSPSVSPRTRGFRGRSSALRPGCDALRAAPAVVARIVTTGPSARSQLGLLSVAIVLAMAPWFAATVVADPLARELALSPWQVSWLTLAVQLGFVLGSLTSAGLLLSDLFSARRLAAA